MEESWLASDNKKEISNDTLGVVCYVEERTEYIAKDEGEKNVATNDVVIEIQTKKCRKIYAHVRHQQRRRRQKRLRLLQASKYAIRLPSSKSIDFTNLLRTMIVVMITVFLMAIHVKIRSISRNIFLSIAT